MYGGTKEELKRLIADAASYTDIQKEMGITVDASSTSFANIVNAIAVVQGKLGIAGATAQEAATTIEGSLNSMKASWQNLLTGIADDNADFDVLINNMVESVGAFGKNILPRIEVALNGAVKLIEGLFPKIIEALPSLINTLLPSTVNGALNIVQALVTALSDNGNLLIQAAMDAVVTLASGVLKMLPQVVKLGLNLVISLANAISEALPKLMPVAVETVLQIVDTLTDPDTLENLLDAAITLIGALMDAFFDAEATEKIYNAIFKLVDEWVRFLLDGDNLAKIIEAAIKLIIALNMGMMGQKALMVKTIIKLIGSIAEAIFTADWEQIGEDIVIGLRNGIEYAWKNLKEWFTSLFGDLIGIAKKILGIASPSKVFKKLGSWTAEGYGIGFEDAFKDVENDIEDALDFGEADYGITTSNTSIGDFNGASSRYGYGSSQSVNVTVGIDNSANAMGLARALLPFLKVAEKEVYA